MADTHNTSQPVLYQIQLQGQLDRDWGEWFGCATIASDDDDTTLLVCQVDQAALYGLLRQIRDLGLPLISVNRIHPSADGNPEF